MSEPSVRNTSGNTIQPKSATSATASTYTMITAHTLRVERFQRHMGCRRSIHFSSVAIGPCSR